MRRDLHLTFVVESGTDVRLVEGLNRHFRLDVICRAIQNGFHINWEPRPGVEVTVGPARRLSFARFLARRLVARPGPDIVLVQGYAVAALVVNVIALLRGFLPVMLICSPVEAYYECRRGASDPRVRFHRAELLGLKALARANARIGQEYVVLSRFLSDLVSSHGTRGSIDIVPLYGVDVERFVPSRANKVLLRSRLGIPVSGEIVFYSSRIAPEKDADTVLRAIGELVRNGRDVWLLNRSGGHDAFMMRAQALGVASRVLTGGPVHPRLELPEFYQAADVCVQASREEGLGFSPLEALACGIPVVATAIGGLRETIIDGRTGWSYPRGDVGALVTALLDVFDRPGEAARRTVLGRQMVLERFAEAKVFDDFERRMRELVYSRAPCRGPEARHDPSRGEPHA
jgi:glycosyltransferase involved in cell wall biosynthesis